MGKNVKILRKKYEREFINSTCCFAELVVAATTLMETCNLGWGVGDSGVIAYNKK